VSTSRRSSPTPASASRSSARWPGSRAGPRRRSRRPQAALAGRPHLLYFWFSGCPPCTRTAPLLTELERRFGGRGLTIVALNADRALEVPSADAERAAYARKNGWSFALAEASPETIEAYGSVSIYPSFFFVDRRGVVVRQLVALQELATWSAAAERALE
jgi:thiol-disulfide isomerase/thioredoxin